MATDKTPRIESPKVPDSAPTRTVMNDELWNDIYGGKTRYFENYLDKVDIASKKTLREIVDEKSEKLGIDPNYLYNTLIAEGLDHYKGFSDSKNLSAYDEEFAQYLRQGKGLDAFTLVGLDTIGDVKEELFRKGYLDREEYKNKVEGGARKNEKGEDVNTGHYSDLDYLVENVAAYLKNDEDKIEDYTKKEEINFTPLQKKFFQSVAYNSGMGNARKMIKSYKDRGFLEDDKFIFEKPNEYWSGPYKNARRRMSGIMGMEDTGVFKSNEDLTAILNEPSDKIKYKSRSRRETGEPVSTLTQEGVQKGEMLRDVDLRKEAEVASTLEPQTPETASLNNIEIQNLSAMGIPDRSVLEREPEEPRPLGIPQQEFADLQGRRDYYEEEVNALTPLSTEEQQLEIDVPTRVENTQAPTPSENMDLSFGEAFAKARQELGAGQTFDWRGNKYTTNLKEEYQKGGEINMTGYKKGTKTENNPYNVIPSNTITMEGVGKQLLAIKLDEDGLPIGMKFMKPGEEYKFENTESVIEVPKYQFAGWANPAKPPSWMQATGVSLSGNSLPTTPVNQPFTYGEPGTEQTLDEFGNPISVPTRYGPHTAQEQANMQQAYAQTYNPTQLLGDVPGAPTVDDSAESEVPVATLDGVESGPESTGMYQNFGMPFSKMTEGMETGLGDNKMKIEPTSPLYKERDLKIGNNAVGVGDETFATKGPDKLKMRERPNIQFYNPYGGTDIPGAAVGLGAAIENKSTLGIIGNAAKLATGLGRNVVGGIGTQRANNRTMDEYYKNLNKSLDGTTNYGQLGGEVRDLEVRYIPGVYDMQGENYMQEGGRIKKEELLTGEYLQGVDQNMPEQMAMIDGEVEAGEYYQTNQGDIAEVVGNSHAQGGEKIPMEEGDRVLTDHTKLGAKNAKDIRDNYDIEVRAKDTYSKVLDKFRSKIGLDKLVKEEEQLIKKLEEQESGDPTDTTGLNIHFLQNKLAETRQKKEPIEQARKFLYDKLFDMQEASKPKEEEETINEYQPGGRYYGRNEGIGHIPEGQSNNGTFYGGVTQEDFLNLIRNNPWYDWQKFDPNNPEDIKDFQRKAGIKADGLLGDQTADVRFAQRVDELPRIGIGEIRPQGSGILPRSTYQPGDITGEEEPSPAMAVAEENQREQRRKALNVMNLPDQYPMMPGGIEPHLKDQRRFDRIDPVKIGVEPYLNQIYQQQNVARAQTEGYSPALQAALNANLMAESQKSLTDLGMKVDAQNLGMQFQADAQNAQTQRMEENARMQDNLSYEQRQLMAKAKTDAEYRNYFDKTQQVNLGNYATIDAMNNANARYSDIAFDGTSYITAPHGYSGDIMRQRIEDILKSIEEDKKKDTRTV